ncbi:MAG: hypothetical protein ABSD09_16010, partial [Xanthobacteraceae bacterium]
MNERHGGAVRSDSPAMANVGRKVISQATAAIETAAKFAELPRILFEIGIGGSVARGKAFFLGFVDRLV